MGLEKLHPFDAGKWGKVINFLKGKNPPTPTPLDWLLHFPVLTTFSDLHLPSPFFLLPILITPSNLHLPPPSLYPSHPYLISAPRLPSTLLLKGLYRQAAKQDGPCLVFPPVRALSPFLNIYSKLPALHCAENRIKLDINNTAVSIGFVFVPLVTSYLWQVVQLSPPL